MPAQAHLSPRWRVWTAIAVGTVAVAVTVLAAAAWVRSRAASSDFLTISRTSVGPGTSREATVTLASASGVLVIDSWHRQQHIADLVAGLGLQPATARQVEDSWQRQQHAKPWHSELKLGFYPGNNRFRQPIQPFGSESFGLTRMLSGDEMFTQLRLPYWALLCFGVVVATLAGLPQMLHRRRARRVAAGLCIMCGYDLRASNAVCPECGTPVRA